VVAHILWARGWAVHMTGRSQSLRGSVPGKV